jgi:hypothetical protein
VVRSQIFDLRARKNLRRKTLRTAGLHDVSVPGSGSRLEFHNFLGESISNRKIVGLFEDFVSEPYDVEPRFVDLL